MKELQELMQMADRICDGLDRISQIDKTFCEKMTNQIEGMSWEALKIRNDLKEIGRYQDVVR